MDTLRVDDFEWDDNQTVQQKIAHWKAKKLWFFTVKESAEHPGKYTAVDDGGRYIGIYHGSPTLFDSEESALSHALHYNNDIIKIRQGAAIKYQNNKTGPHISYA